MLRRCLLLFAVVSLFCVRARPDTSEPRPPLDLDVRIKADGSVFVLATDHNWQELTKYNRDEVKKESIKAPPLLNYPTWTDYWRDRFTKTSLNAENPKRYLKFIVELRRKSGLPELPKDLLDMCK